MTLPTLIVIGVYLVYRAALHEWLAWLELGRQYRRNERLAGREVRIIPLEERLTLER